MGLESKSLKELLRIRGKLLRKIASASEASEQDQAELRELETWIDLRIKEQGKNPPPKPDP